MPPASAEVIEHCVVTKQENANTVSCRCEPVTTRIDSKTGHTVIVCKKMPETRWCLVEDAAAGLQIRNQTRDENPAVRPERWSCRWMNPHREAQYRFSRIAFDLMARDSPGVVPRKPFLHSRVVIGLLAIVPATLRFECA
jgi:hypothetical protein